MSDLEEFALDVLQRAKARSKVLKETLGKPDVTLSVETRESSPEPADENVAISDQIIEEDEEQQYGHVIKDSPSKAIGNAAAIAAMDSNLSDSPLRRTRLRALAQTINNWEDDYSHHYTPQSSRFNLSSKPKSPLRKLPSSPITLPDTSDNNRPSGNNNSSEGIKADGSSNGESTSEKCVLDDSVIHALAAQGYVRSPASAKLYYEYKDKDKKDNKPQQYQLPGPTKTEPPVKRAASPVRPTPVCSKSPSPTRPVPPVDNAPRVVDLVRKQFEAGERPQQGHVSRPAATTTRVESTGTRFSVAQKAALYESMNASNVKEVDPTELSVAERMKLFEKRKGQFAAPSTPKVPSPTRGGGSSVPTRRPPRPSMVPAMPLKDRLKMFEQGVKEEDSETEDSDSQEPRQSTAKYTPLKPDVVPKGVPPPPPLPTLSVASPVRTSPTRAAPSPRSIPESVRSASPKRLHFSNLQEIREARDSDSSDDDNTMVQSPPRPSPKKEVSFGLPPKSPGKCSSPSPSGKRSMSPKANYPGTRDVKRIRVNEPKPGRIYPSLTDIETTETETDTDFDNAEIRPLDTDEEMDSETSTISRGSSLGAYIERKAIENSPLRSNEKHRRFRPSEDFNASLACRQVDALIDEALEGQDYSMSIDMGSSSPVATSSPLKTTTRSPSPISKIIGQNLVHTVSFYRRQQTLNVASPKVVITPKRLPAPACESPIEERTFSVEDHVNEIIKKLEVEAQAQQRSMAQASKALSLCKATMEFSDSRENVECERVLLIATQKHSALVNEIHRLKTEGILGRLSAVSPSKGECAPTCKGNMAIQEIAVELKREFLSRATKGETVYHFITLVKYRNQLEASTLLSLGSGVSSSHLRSGILHFPNAFTVTNLEPDFKVTVEVFVFETLREYLPHEAKYHIKKQDKNKLTPKKHKGDHSKFTHFQHSPAGPDAVQPCKFRSVGSLSIDISTLQRCHWQFERVAATGPLEGSVAMRIHCSAEGGVEERGFLTIFQDISGYGDWHRRWCKLTSNELSYWMYPEDESNDPLGRIVLRHCVTSRVGPVPRDVCARANTFLLVTTRPPIASDRDTLVTSCHGDYTAVRHLISADTREERDLWCKQFNRALANLRAWDPHAHSPDDTLF